MNGIVPLYKPRGMTSFDCVSKIRGILHQKKVGHSGTLDPNVDGVLPICVGKATKVVPYLMASGKVYEGSVILGFSTTTEDLDGDIVEQQTITQAFLDGEIDEAMLSLTGEITQIPPMYSAIKINGKKLYEYAREGIEIDRPARKITIKSFERIGDPKFDAQKGTQTINFKVQCSKGTYVRTLAVDLGRKLGVPAVMSQLTRTQSGGFQIEDTVTFSKLEEAVENGTIETLLTPLDHALEKYPHFALNEDLWTRVQNGAVLKRSNFDQPKDAEPVLVLTHADRVQALYQYDQERAAYRPLTMLLTE
ncbi:tRNA pseudouridine(55) synthase TruB [Pediococcus inopinatus]|uniref:tRNA pseudouridine(55) synthase TruB n=1 Tax=Pediococcus inopinatus TaxID=114090 RepID=UPI002B259F25|nr:tRNA pseudouridine(55) synthase TruB [Pediococcus inopinatus]WPC17697.1 tRNA pseudouridine(55) synthase TruB [Pediococcus inopinatus]